MPWTRTKLVAALRERRLTPKKRLGQNFLIDPNFLEALAESTGITRKSGVVEIGSGPGNLTERLAARAGHVWAFEIDPDLCKLSREELRGLDNVTFVNADGAEFASHVDPGIYAPLTIVSNLPYSDYHRILLRLISTALPIGAWYLMLQRDVYDRLAAGPGEPRYGPMSVILQGLFEMKMLRRAGPKLFFPAPRVESVFFSLRRRPQHEWKPQDIPRLEKGLRALFAGKRKKLGTVLGRSGGKLSETAKAISDRRVETIEPAVLLNLATLLGGRAT